MDQLIFYIALFGGTFVCLQGLGQLVVKDKRQFNNLLGAINFCGGILLFHFCLELRINTYDSFRLTDVYEPSINFIISVLTYFSFRQLIDADFRLTRRDFFHFTPAILSLLILAAFYIAKINQKSNFNDTFEIAHEIVYYSLYVISSFWLLAYSLYNIKMGYVLIATGKSQ